jgi:hypothetical protein
MNLQYARTEPANHWRRRDIASNIAANGRADSLPGS